jgi:outer membrane lipoprotein carrier protein
LLSFSPRGSASAGDPNAPTCRDAATDLHTVLDRMQKRYDQAKDFHARFSQNYSRAVVGRATLSTGTITFKKPGRMRWDYDKPEPRMFLSNGQVLWLYEPTRSRPSSRISRPRNCRRRSPFSWARARSPTSSTCLCQGCKHGRPGDFRLALSPKQPQSAYKSILFIVDPKEFLVRESVLVDSQGNTNHFIFDDLEVKRQGCGSVFKWTPPAGVRVVDTGQMGK